MKRQERQTHNTIMQLPLTPTTQALPIVDKHSFAVHCFQSNSETVNLHVRKLLWQPEVQIRSQGTGW